MTTTMTKRSSPLTAEPAAPNGTHPPVDPVPRLDDLSGTARQERLLAGVQRLRVGAGRLALGERSLMVAGGVIAPLGIMVVLLGYWGASHTPYTFEQTPYLISGGLLGLGLVFLGSFLYFTHWLTQLVKEHRAQSSAIIDALQRLQEEVARGSDTLPVAGEAAGASLVATARGTMAHLRDCVVVAGKPNLRAVEATNGLTACRLCEPY